MIEEDNINDDDDGILEPHSEWLNETNAYFSRNAAECVITATSKRETPNEGLEPSTVRLRVARSTN